MFCTNCGNRIDRPSKFCPVCGTALEQSASAQVGYTPWAQHAGYTQTQPAGYMPQREPTRTKAPSKKKRLSTGALIGIVAGGAAVLALLVFLGISLFEKPARTGGDKPDLKAAGGVWSGVLRFDEYFPEDGTSSALVYASDEGILPCTLNVEKGGGKAELVVRDVTIPLTVEATEHALRFKGSMDDETITLNANIGADGLVSLSGDGSVTIGGEDIPLSLRFVQQSDEAPTLDGGGGTLPKPPSQIAAPIETAPELQSEDAGADTSAPIPAPESDAEPPALIDVLPGLWVTDPDRNFRVTVFSFDNNGLMCHGLASSEGETTLEGWFDDGVWEFGNMTWRAWTVDGDTVTMSNSINEDTVRIIPKNEEWIVVYYEYGSEGYEFHRMAGVLAPDEYMIGTWVPDQADKDGVHAVLTLERGGHAVLTGAKGVSGKETPADWGNEGSWKILGTKEGMWWMEADGRVMINMGDKDDTYRISITGPDNAVFAYGADWKAAYTRVA